MIDISFNKITKLSGEFFETIVNVEILNLQNNKVGGLPEDFKKLTNLKELNISAIFKEITEEESLLDYKDSEEDEDFKIFPEGVDVSLNSL